MKKTLTSLALVLSMGASILVSQSGAAIRPVPDSMTNAIQYPFWATNIIRGESVMFLRSNVGDTPRGTLLFTPSGILQVRRVDGKVIYNAGTDYQISGRGLILPAGSQITNKLLADLFVNSNFYDPVTNKHWMKYRVSDPLYWLYYKEADFSNMQVEVDYTTSETWTGYKPSFESVRLSNVIRKLKNREPVKIAFMGDSLTGGANASGSSATSPFPPYMPKFAEAIADMLMRLYGGTVSISNLGVGGSWANDMTNTKVPHVIGFAPDLTIIGYGMNDVNGSFPNTYKNNIQAAIHQCRVAHPSMEFILIASCLAHPEWNWTPAAQFPLYEAALSTLVGNGVALANMTALWTGMMTNKRYYDLTGNGINHPNDFGHRSYTAVLLNLLWDRNVTASNVAPTNAPATKNAFTTLTPKTVFSPAQGLHIGLGLLPSATAVEIHIYAYHGAQIKKLTSPATGLFVSQSYAFWDGYGLNGKSLPTGNYVLLLYVAGKQVDFRKILLSSP